MKSIAYNREGKAIGYFYDDTYGRRFVPNEDNDPLSDQLRNLYANQDFDGVLEKVVAEKMDTKKLEHQLSALLFELKDLSTYDSMSKKSQLKLITMARKAINVFYQHAKIESTKAVTDTFNESFVSLFSALNQYTHIKKEFVPPDVKLFRQALLIPKLSELNHYVNKALQMFSTRITLFDLYKKGGLESELAAYVSSQQGGLTHYEQVDELMSMLDKDYPAGFLRVPIVKVMESGEVFVTTIKSKSSRKIALDYYISVWLRDLNAMTHNAAMQSLYMHAGIDLVLYKNADESEICPICKNDNNKIFSLYFYPQTEQKKF